MFVRLIRTTPQWLMFTRGPRKTLEGVSLVDIKAIQDEWRSEYIDQSSPTPYVGAVQSMGLAREHSESDFMQGGFEEWFFKWFGSDPDDACAYSTPKITKIRSWQVISVCNVYSTWRAHLL
jgi:hypothetical protein